MSDKKAKKEPAMAPTQQLMTDGNLDQIRDILFGSQKREMEKRFEMIEERMRQDLSEMRDEMKSQFNRLETYVKGEVDALSSKLKKEQQERSTAIEEINTEHKDTRKKADQRHGDFEEEVDKNFRDARQQILDQGQELTETIRKARSEIDTKIDWAVRELREVKTDKSELASIFTELGMRISRAPEDEE